MYVVAVFVACFILGIVFAKEIRVALVSAVVFALLTVGLVGWNTEPAEGRALRGAVRDTVPHSLVGTWEGSFRDGGPHDDQRVRVTVRAGKIGAVVAVVRTTRVHTECMETGVLTRATDHGIVLKPKPMLGTRRSCGGSYQLTTKGDRAAFRGEGGSEAAVSRSRTRPAPGIAAVTGEWRGTFTCGRGVEGATLTIRSAGGNKVTAVFRFYAVRGNRGAASGSSAKVGVYHEGHITLHHDRWIKKPANHRPMDLSADVDSGNPRTTTGRMLSRGCKTFTITRHR